jgi:hypothetical protein
VSRQGISLVPAELGWADAAGFAVEPAEANDRTDAHSELLRIFRDCSAILRRPRTSAFAFFVIEGYVLHDQWEIGHASAMYMLGTAFLVAGFCIGLFAIIGYGIGDFCGVQHRTSPSSFVVGAARFAPIADSGLARTSVPTGDDQKRAAGPQTGPLGPTVARNAGA